MAQPCRQEVELRRTLAPEVPIVFHAEGDTQGEWDAERVRQLVGNLLANALKYGDRRSPVRLELTGQGEEVELAVSNSGPTLPADRLETIFDPLHREPSNDADVERSSLGLGLYIVRAIAQAHRAAVSASSSEGVTVFRVRWPKRPG